MKRIFLCALFLSSALVTHEIRGSWAKNIFFITAATGITIIVWKVCKEVDGGIKKFLGTDKIDKRIGNMEETLKQNGNKSDLNFTETNELLKEGFDCTSKDCQTILDNQGKMMEHLGIKKNSFQESD